MSRRRRLAGPAPAGSRARSTGARFFAALYAIGYDYVVSIEHEDRAFEGSVEAVQRGFLIARDNLRPYIR